MCNPEITCSIGSDREDSKNQVLRSTVLNYGHVTAACFTEDGHRLLSAVGDGQIRVRFCSER